MKKGYRQWIQLISSVVIVIALIIALIHRGVIPKFWEPDSEPATEVIAPADGTEPPQTQTGPAEVQDEPDETQQENGDETVDEEPSDEPDVSETVEEADPAQQLEDYLAQDPRQPREAKGIFITGAVAGTQNTMPELAKLVEDTSLNAMVIDIKNDSGEVTYDMGLPLAEEIGAQTRYVSDMPGLIQQLKEKDIYLIARIVAFKDPILAEKEPKYAVKNPDGSVFHDNNDLAWVNPYREEVWDYLIDLSKEAVALGFDEIQYDYIRFSTAQGIADADFGLQMCLGRLSVMKLMDS